MPGYAVGRRDQISPLALAVGVGEVGVPAPRIHHLLNRGETRNSLARDVFHGHRGQLRKHY